MFIAVAAIFLIISVRSKMYNNYRRRERETIINSPLAEAISQLVGISGGIYLALLSAAEFLGINSGYQIKLAGYYFNALALLAIFLAAMQPIIILLWQKIMHR